MARTRTRSTGARRSRRRAAAWHGMLADRLLPALLALALSFGAILNTVGVAAHNLGARPGLHFVNGGKIFLPRGAMWYHIPGLGDLDLAPQNIGGQGNLRNNDVAVLDRNPARLQSVDVDFSLAPDAYALLILEQSGEGSLLALRLSAMTDPASPFDNALVRFVDGTEVERQPLEQLGPTLASGRHQLHLGPAGATSQLQVDGHDQPLDLDLAGLAPALALGSGERDLSLHRWAVSGLDAQGAATTQVLAWSRLETVGHWGWGLLRAAGALWLLLVGAPVLAVAWDCGQAPDRLLVAATLRPRARPFYGLLCLLPVMPLLPQVALLANFLLLIGWGLMAALLSVPPSPPLRQNEVHAPISRARALALGLGLVGLGAGLLALGQAQRAAPLGDPMAPSAGAPLARLDETGPLELGVGRRLRLPPTQGRALRLSGDVQLEAGEVLRIDLVQQLPGEADLFQVDRASVYAADSIAGAGAEGPQSFDGLSVLLSARPGLPSEILRAEEFKVDRSAGAWTLDPGAHRIDISVDLPFVTVAVDGRIREIRGDLAGVFDSGARGGASTAQGPQGLLLQAWSDRVSSVGAMALTEESVPAAGREALGRAAPAVALGALLLSGGGALLLLGLGPAARRERPRALLRQALLSQRALALALLLWLAATLWPGLGAPGWPLRTLLVLVVVWAAVQVLRRLRAGGWGATAAGLGLVVQLIIGVEGLSWLWPQWRHGLVSTWNHGLAEDQRWAYDPMLRRLNPWYVDMRFQRRPWTLDRPDGRTRVVVFGGSQTYGWGIPSRDRQTFSDRIQRRLRDQGHDVEVINAAFPGGKTETGLRWFEGNLARYQPDIVVLNYLVNEFMDVDTHGVWAGRHGPDATLAPLAALAWLRRLPADVRTRHIVQVVLAHRYDMGDLEGNLRRWVAAARSRGVRVLLSVEATNLYVETAGAEIMRQETDAGAAQGVIHRVGADLGVPVYDPLPQLLEHPTDLYFFDTMHLSRHGHAVIGDGLAEQIAAELLPSPSPAP